MAPTTKTRHSRTAEPWWTLPLRIADFNPREFALERIPEMVARKRELHFNTEHMSVFGFGGGDRGIFYFDSSAAREQPFDFLGPYLEEAHAAGLRVLIYFNVHWLHAEFAGEHEDWLQRRSDGSVVDDVYGLGMSPCVNSPGYRRWSFKVIRDLARYQIDGIFLDGPIFTPAACWCEACSERFQRETGEKLPERQDWESGRWKEFIEFRYRSITRYMRDARKALKKVRPDAVIYMNGQGLWPSWPNGRNNRLLQPHQDIIGAEGGFIGGDLRTAPLWKPSMSAKLLESQAGGKPRVIFIAGKNCGWDLYALTPAETTILYAQTIAHGASPWYGMFYEQKVSAGARAAGRMNLFIQRNEDYLRDTVSPARVALMWSIRTADYYRATVPVTDFTQEGKKLTRQEKAGDHYKSFTGYFECLTRNHVQFDVLDEEGVRRELNRYAVLILPNVACLHRSLATRISRWVAAGGRLVATFETSFYTDWGIKRHAPLLGDLLGVHEAAVEGPCTLDYFDRGEDEYFSAIEAPLIPSPRYRVLVEPAEGSGGTEEGWLAFYRQRYPARYQPLPPLSAHPAMIRRAVRKGEVLYFCGNVAESYEDYHVPEYERLMCAPVEDAAEQLGQARVETDAPQTLQIVLRSQPERKRLIVHLINLTGEMTRPVQRVVSLRSVRLRFPGIRGARRARLLVREKEVVMQGAVAGRRGAQGSAGAHGQGVSVTVPRVDDYEVVVLEGVR